MGRFKAPAPAPPTPRKVKGVPLTTSELSLVAAFDDLVRNGSVFSDGAEQQFLIVVKNAQEWRQKWHLAEMERQRLSLTVSERERELAGKDYQIKQARKFVEEEKKLRQRVEEERDNLQKQVAIIKDLLLADGGKTLNNETLERIRHLNHSPFPAQNHHVSSSKLKSSNHNQAAEMEAVIEQSNGSLMDASDLSFDETREDVLLDGTRLRSGHVYKRRSSQKMNNQHQRRSNTKRRSHSMGGILTTSTTVTLGQDGHAQAEAVMTVNEVQEKVKRSRKSRQDYNYYEPSAPPMTPTTETKVKRTFSNASSVPSRPHCFQKKTDVRMEKCHPCGKRVKFGKSILKCKDCGAVCHPECKHEVPLPCIAGVSRTPSNKTGNFLADYTPVEPPMIPALLVHCVKEVEERGLGEVGLYRVPGNESESNEILDKFLHSRTGVPKLTKYDIHAVTSCIKKFLRSLKEPIIPLSLWKVFVDAATNPDNTDGESSMYQAISELPLPNRDTLAYLMLHLQTVAENYRDNKMDKDNLAMIMGPTVVGYSSDEPMAILGEADKQKAVMRTLIGISSDYWSRFLSVESNQENLFGYLNAQSRVGGTTPDHRIFAPINGVSPLAPPKTGGPAKRTRSKQLPNPTKRQHLFQSPMLF